MSKQFLLIVAIVIALLGGTLVLTKKSDNKANTDGAKTSTNGSNHRTGNLSSKVTLTEFGDFQCPACKSYYPIIKQVKEEYKDKIIFEFRHFPLVQIHPNAFIASRSAEAAGNQNKFFEYHDLLYENQDSWAQSQNPSSMFEEFAKQLGLDITKFKADVVSEQTADIINADAKKAQSIGANSTPTFAINNKKIDNPKSIEEFKKVIDEALASNK
ncbi:MAG: thioredoxin domain-containing protein [Patescibacteria group bacterium]